MVRCFFACVTNNKGKRRLVMITAVEAKKRYTEVFKKHITRPGCDDLWAFIENSDFFKAPASTKYHCSFDGGLVIHSVNVFERLRKLIATEEGMDYSDETVAIAALCHDLCKANFYTVEMRNRKNAQGAWEKYPVFAVDDKLPMGHGEKSLFLLQRHIKLATEEALAVRWHMGSSDASVKGGEGMFAMGKAYNTYPLCVMLHIADMQATYLDEIEEEQ